ncbi:MAG: arsenate reductase ArsC [Haliscomenobacter sp.]|nr:arsenate reductase ArsC [Haliscomenobacter sp.]
MYSSKSILVLCAGNASRSQMAEGYLRFFNEGYGAYYSAGLESHGVHPLTIQVMAEDNIDISHHLSKTYHLFESNQLDYLITVCDSVRDQIPAGLTFERHVHFSIPDPALFQGDESEKLRISGEVREMVKQEILRFIGQELLPKDQLAFP